MGSLAKTSPVILFCLLLPCCRPGSRQDPLKDWLVASGEITGAEIITVPIENGKHPLPVRESPEEIVARLREMAPTKAPEIKVAVKSRLVVHSKAGGDLQMNYLSDDSWSVGTNNYYKGPATPFSTK